MYPRLMSQWSNCSSQIHMCANNLIMVCPCVWQTWRRRAQCHGRDDRQVGRWHWRSGEDAGPDPNPSPEWGERTPRGHGGTTRWAGASRASLRRRPEHGPKDERTPGTRRVGEVAAGGSADHAGAETSGDEGQSLWPGSACGERREASGGERSPTPRGLQAAFCPRPVRTP